MTAEKVTVKISYVYMASKGVISSFNCSIKLVRSMKCLTIYA